MFWTNVLRIESTDFKLINPLVAFQKLIYWSYTSEITSAWKQLKAFAECTRWKEFSWQNLAGHILIVTRYIQHPVKLFFFFIRYWALAAPAYAMMTIALAVGFYIGLNFLATPPPTSFSMIYGNCYLDFLGMRVERIFLASLSRLLMHAKPKFSIVCWEHNMSSCFYIIMGLST